MAALSPITWESQRSAGASCDRAEIVAPFLCRADHKLAPSAECEFDVLNRRRWAVRRLLSQTRIGGSKSPVFQLLRAPGQLRVRGQSLVGRRARAPPRGNLPLGGGGEG